jgi:hypothetical protein
MPSPPLLLIIHLFSTVEEIPASYFVFFTFCPVLSTSYWFIYFQEKKQFVNELERHKEALKRLSDEVEKLKIIIGNIPEVIIYKKNIVQLN